MEPTRPEAPPARDPGLPRTPNRRQALPTWLRVSLIVAGLLLVAVGIAGLVLPGIQGIVTILAGLALLSLVSRQTHRFLRWSLRPWPRMRKRVERLRFRFQGWLHRKLGRGSNNVGETVEEVVEEAEEAVDDLLEEETEDGRTG